jgi:hypothetical protein
MGTFAALLSPSAGAGPWSIEPRVGVAAEYVGNPQLRADHVQPEENIAATVDLPVSYDADSLGFLVRPSGRLADRKGYSSLASNYEHLDAAAHFGDELDALAVQGQLARDSSLFFVGGLVNGIGVPRDSANANADWTRSVTERQQVQLDASWTRVRYVEPLGLNALVDYRYVSAGPTYSVAMSERNTLQLLGSYGLYQSLNGITESRSENLQLAFVRQLTELWTLSTSAGYSRSVNSQKVYATFFFGTFFLGEAKSNQNGAVYAATLARQGERFNLSIGASQALQPTGFAFLSRQNSVKLNATYARNERWDFTAGASWLRAVNPRENGGAAVNGTETTTRYLNAALTANWHWTPQWTISLSAARITQQYGPPPLSAASTNISVAFVRQFLRTQFQ